jgi:hypothetical protein
VTGIILFSFLDGANDSQQLIGAVGHVHNNRAVVRNTFFIESSRGENNGHVGTISVFSLRANSTLDISGRPALADEIHRDGRADPLATIGAT